MIKNCLGCGVEKDDETKEKYPYPNEGYITDEAIEPFFILECEGTKADWRLVRVCHECFHKLDPDMWISKKCWDSIIPVVPFEQLPAKVSDL